MDACQICRSSSPCCCQWTLIKCLEYFHPTPPPHPPSTLLVPSFFLHLIPFHFLVVQDFSICSDFFNCPPFFFFFFRRYLMFSSCEDECKFASCVNMHDYSSCQPACPPPLLDQHGMKMKKLQLKVFSSTLSPSSPMEKEKKKKTCFQSHTTLLQP